MFHATGKPTTTFTMISLHSVLLYHQLIQKLESLGVYILPGIIIHNAPELFWTEPMAL